MDILANALFCIPAACIPFLPLLPFYRSCRLWGCQGQVWRRRERRRKVEREDWQSPGGQLECLCFCVPHSHLHRQNGFFPLSDCLFSSLSPSIYTHHFNSFLILFLFFPRCCCHFQEWDTLLLPFFCVNFLFSFYRQLPFFPFYRSPTFTFSHLSSGFAELCVSLIRCTAIFWRWRLIFTVRALQRPHSPPTISIHLPPTFSCSHDCF